MLALLALSHFLTPIQALQNLERSQIKLDGINTAKSSEPLLLNPSLPESVLGHPKMPPPFLGISELYSRSKKDEQESEHRGAYSFNFEGKDGVRLTLQYDGEIQKGNKIVSLDKLKGIKPESTVRANPNGDERVEVHFQIPSLAAALVQKLNIRESDRYSSVYVTGGMHWGSQHPSSKDPRPLLLDLSQASLKDSRVVITGKPVQYQQIFKNLNLTFTTNAFTPKINPKTDGKTTAKSMPSSNLLHHSEAEVDNAAATSTNGQGQCIWQKNWKDAHGYTCDSWAGHSCIKSWTNGNSWRYSAEQMQDVRNHCPQCNACNYPAGCTDTPNFKDVHGYSCKEWNGYSCDPYSISNWRYTEQNVRDVLKNCKIECGTCSGMPNFQPSWFETIANTVAGYVKNAYQSVVGQEISNLMEEGKIIWNIAKLAVTGNLNVDRPHLRHTCWEWNYDCLKGESKNEVFTFDTAAQLRCENCYIKSEFNLAFKVDIAEYVLKNLLLEGTGDLDMNFDVKADFKGSYDKNSDTLIAKSLIGDQQFFIDVLGIPIYIQMKVPLKIGSSTQVDSQLSMYAKARASGHIHSGFQYSQDKGLSFFNPSPQIQHSGSFDAQESVNFAGEVHLLPVVRYSVYSLAELNIGFKTGVVFSLEKATDRQHPCYKSFPNLINTYASANAALSMTVSGGLDVNWGILKYKKLTKPNVIFHQMYPIYQHCWGWYKNQLLLNEDSQKKDVILQQSKTNFEPKGIVRGQIYHGSFHVNEQCKDDFMPSGQLTIFVKSVDYGRNTTKCPDSSLFIVTATDSTEPNHPSPHACMNAREIQVKFEERKGSDRCTMHFDLPSSSEANKFCTKEEEKKSRCNNFPILAGSADSDFSTIRLHDEHLRADGADCVRGHLYRKKDKVVKDDLTALNKLSNETGHGTGHVCAEIKKRGYCFDADVSECCAATCGLDEFW